ncbi:MAG: hypothetical protein WD066_15225 [Planctomycetaceae bacterium]
MAAPSVTDVRETEQQLVARAQESVSQCNWTVGECAAVWTKKHARGRTDADFAAMVGLSSDQVYQRRRVWETFSDVRERYPGLKWSHFYVALNWDDAPECLQWGEENQVTVAEMKAWRRARHGEDLTAPPADDWGGDPAIAFVPATPTEVRAPGNGGHAISAGRNGGERAAVESSADRQAAVAREAAASEEEPGRERIAVAEKPQANVEQVALRMISQLERINNAFTPEFGEQFRRLPGKVRGRLVKAVGELGSKVADMG